MEKKILVLELNKEVVANLDKSAMVNFKAGGDLPLSYNTLCQVAICVYTNYQQLTCVPRLC